jgi:hypothetical protein
MKTWDGCRPLSHRVSPSARDLLIMTGTSSCRYRTSSLPAPTSISTRRFIPFQFDVSTKISPSSFHICRKIVQAETLIGKGGQLRPSPRAQKQAPSWTKTRSCQLLSRLLSLCSGLLRGAQSRLSLGSVSAQFKAAPLRMEAITGTGEKKSYVRLSGYLRTSYSINTDNYRL